MKFLENYIEKYFIFFIYVKFYLIVEKMPNLVVIAIKRLLNGILCLCGLIRRFLTFRWLRRPQRIGELPTVMANRQNNMEEYLPSAGQQYSLSDGIGGFWI